MSIAGLSKVGQEFHILAPQEVWTIELDKVDKDPGIFFTTLASIEFEVGQGEVEISVTGWPGAPKQFNSFKMSAPDRTKYNIYRAVIVGSKLLIKNTAIQQSSSPDDDAHVRAIITGKV